MRVLPLLALAVLLLAGCSSKPSPAAAPLAPADGAALGAPAASATRYALEFAGGYREAEIPVAVTFAPTDACFYITPCTEQRVDLTPVVPPDVPVELSIRLATTGHPDAFVVGSDTVSFVQYSTTEDSGSIAIDILLVRGADGAVDLVVGPGFPFPDNSAAGAGPSVTGTAHAVVRASVVPAYVPVAVTLGPGDEVNATGDGLEQLVAYPPSGGAAIRDLTAPFGFRVPDAAPTGTYILFAVADEAVRLVGPNRTLSAHRLVWSETEPVDLASGQSAAWTMDVPGLPVQVGVILESKDTVPNCCGVAAFVGSRTLSLVAPGNVEVFTQKTDCIILVSCATGVLGTFSDWYGSDFLDEHLAPGAYSATVTPETTNNAQARSYAIYIL